MIRTDEPPYVGIGRVIDPPAFDVETHKIRTYDPENVRMTFKGVELQPIVVTDPAIDVKSTHAGIEYSVRLTSKVPFPADLLDMIEERARHFARGRIRKWRRKKRMGLRRRRGRGACSA